MQVSHVGFTGLSLLFISFFFQLAKADDSLWLIDEISIKSTPEAVEISLKKIDINQQFILTDIEVRCAGNISVYPIVTCLNGQVSFDVEQQTYQMLINLNYDLSTDSWDITVQSENGDITIRSDSNNNQQLRLSLTQTELSQLQELYPFLSKYALPEAVLDAEIIVDLQENLIYLENAKLNQFNWQSEDANHIVADAEIILQGKLEMSSRLQLNLEGNIVGGEALFDQIYLNFSDFPIQFVTDSQATEKGFKSQAIIDSGNIFRTEVSVQHQLFSSIDQMNVLIDVFDLKQLNQLALSPVLDLYGFVNTQLEGMIRIEVDYQNKTFSEINIEIDDLYANNEKRKVSTNGLNARINWSRSEIRTSVLNWQSLTLAGMPVGELNTTFKWNDGDIIFEPVLTVPVFDGAIKLFNFRLTDLFKDEIGIFVKAEVLPISLIEVTEKLDWPIMTGTISGSIPSMQKNGDIIEFGGTLLIQVFSGNMQVNNLSMERLFGVAPVIAADLEFEDFNMTELTTSIDFGKITGRLFGYVKNLRITNWKIDRMDAKIYTSKVKGVKQTISQKALDRISSLGGIKGAISSSFLRFFNDFKYKKIGLSCRLINEVCLIGGLKSRDKGFVIVEGGGIPEINIVGFREKINWQEFVNRLLNANYNN